MIDNSVVVWFFTDWFVISGTTLFHNSNGPIPVADIAYKEVAGISVLHSGL